jgi:hypothetical protein
MIWKKFKMVSRMSVIGEVPNLLGTLLVSANQMIPDIHEASKNMICLP